MTTVVVFRHPNIAFSESRLYRECEALARVTRFDLNAKDQDAPQRTSCITAVRYIFRQCTNLSLPHVWIGDMSRHLVASGWRIIQIDLSQIQAGDLIFLRWNASNFCPLYQRWITHIVLALSPRAFFDSNQSRSARIESLQRPDRIVTDPHRTLLYVDRRNRSLRTYLREAEGAPTPWLRLAIQRPLTDPHSPQNSTHPKGLTPARERGPVSGNRGQPFDSDRKEKLQRRRGPASGPLEGCALHPLPTSTQFIEAR